MPTLKERILPFVSPPDSDAIQSVSRKDSVSIDSNLVHHDDNSGNHVPIVALSTIENNDSIWNSHEQTDNNQKRKRWKKLAKKKPRVFGNEVLTNSRKYLTVPPSPADRQDFYIKPNYYDNGNNDFTRMISEYDRQDLSFEGESSKRTTRRSDRSASSSSSSSSSPVALACNEKEEPSTTSPSSMNSNQSSKSLSTVKSKKTTMDKVSNYKTHIDAQFAKHIAALRDYKNKHGDFNIPSTYPPNQPLSNWVGNINYSYNLIKRGYNGTIRLSKDRLDMLKEIGYVFKDMNVHTKSDSTSKMKLKNKRSVDLDDNVNTSSKSRVQEKRKRRR